MLKRSSATSVTCYSALAVLLAGILLEWWPQLLAATVAGRIGRNSEGFALALVLMVWIEFVRPRLHERRWVISGVLAAGFLAGGLALLASDLPSRFRTLNEAAFAAALLLPYTMLGRPLPTRFVLGAPAVVLAAMLIAHDTYVVTALAETFGILLLAPVALDLVDRNILAPTPSASVFGRYAWYALLIAVPVVVSVLSHRAGSDWLLADLALYAGRITEAFLCLLIVQIYFAVGHRRSSPFGHCARPALAGAG